MPTLEFPPEEDHIELSWWWPLMAVAGSVAGVERYRRLALDDFMVMFKAIRSGRPDVFAYQHGVTRGYLYLDAAVQPYRYVPSRDPTTGRGRYLRLRDLDAALVGLHLWELPPPGPEPDHVTVDDWWLRNWTRRPTTRRGVRKEVREYGRLHVV